MSISPAQIPIPDFLTKSKQDLTGTEKPDTVTVPSVDFTLVERGKAIIKGSNMALTKEGWMMSDTICAELFKIEV